MVNLRHVRYSELKLEELLYVLSKLNTGNLVLFIAGLNYPFPVRYKELDEIVRFVKGLKNIEIGNYLRVLVAQGYLRRVKRGHYSITRKGLKKLKYLHLVEGKIPEIPAMREVKIWVKVNKDGEKIEMLI